MTNNTFNIPHFDPFTFSRGSVGFDEVFKRLSEITKTVGYPPYNIKKTNENTYVIEMAVAGFGKQDIELVLEDGTLTIKGVLKSDENSPNEYIFKGIADRAFTRKFTLADTIEIKNADMINGMLRVWLERFIPENKRSRKIDINTEETKEDKSSDSSKRDKSFLVG